MGFGSAQCERALKETQGNMERAVDWLFSHGDEAVVQQGSKPTKEELLDHEPARMRQRQP